MRAIWTLLIATFITGVLSREPYPSDSVATWLSNMEKAFEEANHELSRDSERDVESLETEDEENDDSWWSSSPFSSSSFLNSWFRSAHVTPWWKGKNVCTSKEEDLAPFAGSNFWSSSLQTQSCYDDSESYVCVSKSTTDDGKSIRTVNVTRQCCHGYRRGRNGCYEVDLKNVMETLEKISATEYLDIVKSSGLTAMFTDSNVTVFAFGDPTTETTTPKFDDNNEPSAVATPVPEFDPEPTTEPDIDNELTVPAYRRRREISLPYHSKLHYHSSKPMRYKRSLATRAKRQVMPVMSSIAPGFHKLSGHVDETVINSAADGSVIRLNLFRGPNASRRFTANCVLVTKPNIEASNGWVHKVDGPVPRAEQTLAQILENEPRFSIFVGLLKSTDLWSQLEDPAGHVTVMAPSNEAFEKLPADQLAAWRMGKSCSKDVIGNHLLSFTLCSTAVWTSASVRTQSNYNLPLRPDPETEGLLLTVNDGKLISLDNSASNGVLHETDTVLIPDLARNLRETLADTNKEWLKIMDEVGFDFSINNVTVLAINDEDLKKPEAVKMLEEARESPTGLNDLVMFYTAPGMSLKDRSEQSGPCDDDIAPLGSLGWLDPLVAGSRPRLFVSSPPMPFRAAHLPSIQCKPVEQVTALCDGARLIQLKKPLEWPKKSLLELVTSDPNLSTFSQLIKKSEKWSQQLRSIDSDAVTLLASTDDAWKEISETDLTQLDENPKLVDSIIGAHIINEPVCCESAPTWPFTGRAVTVDGDSVGLRRDVNGQVNVGKASVEVCNRHATNGIMHLVDTVMFPRLYKQLGGWLLEGNRGGNHHNVDTMLFGI